MMTRAKIDKIINRYGASFISEDDVPSIELSYKELYEIINHAITYVKPNKSRISTKYSTSAIDRHQYDFAYNQAIKQMEYKQKELGLKDE